MSLHVVCFRLKAGESLSVGVDCSNYDRVTQIIMLDDWTGARRSRSSCHRTASAFTTFIV
jgi:hypothetical protein